jgi:cysteinyl-tRNA synthetase, unknown class
MGRLSGRSGLIAWWGAALLVLSAVIGTAVDTDAAAQTRPGGAAERTEVRARAARRATLAAATSWGYQLRIRDLTPLVTATPDLLVIDHGLAARRDDGKLLFERAEIERLKTRADGRRRPVLAYLSIGEAEQYRFYWQAAWCKRATAPAWIGAVNPQWPGNYPVRFWQPDWQRLILDGPQSYLARIKAQGFDGVYLDRADVWSEWTAEHPAAERDMIVFLGRIAATARADDPTFLVVMQNAEELLVHAGVRRVLDGVAKEDLLHGVTFTEAANEPAVVDSAVRALRRARADGLPVFAVEYLSTPALIAAARQRLVRLGFVPTFAPRLLDAMSHDGSVLLAATPPVSPAGPPPARPATGPPAGSWAEGGPTCLVD